MATSPVAELVETERQRLAAGVRLGASTIRGDAV
jgi:hypothetical protein